MIDSTDVAQLREVSPRTTDDEFLYSVVNRREEGSGVKDLASIPLPVLETLGSAITEPEVQWLHGADHSQIACRVWTGQSNAPVLVYLHGIEGHSQWFANTATALNRRGVTIYAPDRRGSGLNSRDRGHVSSYKTLLADLELLLTHVASLHKGQPLVLMGNCWGAKCATIVSSTNYATQSGATPTKLSGLILTCPALHTRPDFDFKTKFDIAINCIRGDLRALKHIPIPLTASMFTQQKAFLDFIEKDPLRLLEATRKFYFESFFLTRRAQKTAKQLNLPLLVLQSGDDPIINIPALEAWYNNVASTDKSMHMFPDAAHSLDFESVWFRDYMNLLNDWLFARTTVV